MTTWMNLEGIILSEIRQRKINTVCFHLYVESKIDEQTRQTVIDTENKQLVVTGELHKGEEINR